jgi:addiction module HigA family antidote
MGRYREALTRLLLVGSFDGRAVAPSRVPESVVVPWPGPAPERRPPPPRVCEPEPEPVPEAAPRKAARPRKFRRELPDAGAVTHPGMVLAGHLSDLGLTASDLARDIGVPVNRVTAIINGQRGVTADTALRLGHWFGVDAEDWLELQLQYELALAREETGDEVARQPRLVDRISRG